VRKVNPMEVKEPERAWEHGEHGAGLVDDLPGAPKRPREIVEDFGLDAAAMRTAMTRRAYGSRF
jgi:hypothetical protein